VFLSPRGWKVIALFLAILCLLWFIRTDVVVRHHRTASWHNTVFQVNAPYDIQVKRNRLWLTRHDDIGSGIDSWVLVVGDDRNEKGTGIFDQYRASCAVHQICRKPSFSRDPDGGWICWEKIYTNPNSSNTRAGVSGRCIAQNKGGRWAMYVSIFATDTNVIYPILRKTRP
jgi:hypothetical protein